METVLGPGKQKINLRRMYTNGDRFQPRRVDQDTCSWETAAGSDKNKRGAQTAPSGSILSCEAKRHPIVRSADTAARSARCERSMLGGQHGRGRPSRHGANSRNSTGLLLAMCRMLEQSRLVCRPDRLTGTRPGRCGHPPSSFLPC